MCEGPFLCQFSPTEPVRIHNRKNRMRDSLRQGGRGRVTPKWLWQTSSCVNTTELFGSRSQRLTFSKRSNYHNQDPTFKRDLQETGHIRKKCGRPLLQKKCGRPHHQEKCGRPHLNGKRAGGHTSRSSPHVQSNTAMM